MGTSRRSNRNERDHRVFPAVAGLMVPVAFFALGGWIFSWLASSPSPPEMNQPLWDGRLLVVIDAGHGGEDGGTQGHELLEKNCTLDVARRAARMLRADGRRVLLTRDSDASLSLSQRTAMANTRKAACFVSIHFNNSSDSSVRGIETYYSDRKEGLVGPGAPDLRPVRSDGIEANRLLAECIQRASVDRSRSADRGIRLRSELAVVRRTECPAALIEGGFLSNKAEALRIGSEAWRERLARGIVDGINRFLESFPAERVNGNARET
jgi:N-acetylmuramoyl-L-alanine amidase